jgi:hypothetical protein
MTAGEPPADLRVRILARLQAPTRSASVWVLVPAAAAMATLAIVATLDRRMPSARTPSTAARPVVAEARPAPAPLVGGSERSGTAHALAGSAGRRAPASRTRSSSDDLGWRERVVPSLAAPDPLAVAAMPRAVIDLPSIMIDPIEPAPPLSIAPIGSAGAPRR